MNYRLVSRQVARIHDRFSNDPSQNMILYLLLAYNEFQQLENTSKIMLNFQGKELIEPSLLRTIREALFLRGRLDKSTLDYTFISRLGRFTYGQ